MIKSSTIGVIISNMHDIIYTKEIAEKL